MLALGLALACAGCGAEDVEPTDTQGTPAADCGQTDVSLLIDCRESTDPLTADGMLALGDEEPHEIELGGPGICHIDAPEGGGDGAYVALEARCSPLAAGVGAVGMSVTHVAHVIRVCESVARVVADWQGTLVLPAGEFRLRIDATSTLADGTSCRLRVGGQPADALGTSATNLWLSFESGPAVIDLELDCGLRDEAGFAALGCVGWTPGLPVSPVHGTFALTLDIVAEPVSR